MQDFETEEQQLDALKQWWKENSSSLFIGLAVGGFALGGWKFYHQTQFEHGVEASDMYVSVVAQAEAGAGGTFDTTVVDKLVAGYSDTPYAALSSLVIAKHEVTAGNIDQAISRLQWAVDHAVEEEITSVAQLRLARLLLSQKKYDEANKLLMTKHSSAFDALYEELKGDMFVARGELEQARIAYDKAIAGSESANRWLQLKRQDLGNSQLNSSELVEPSA
ncbi:MAG: tetratricopeptide repeat protein [Gammaproteobacteria bacterium]|nr:tetratricopeptide repeat protein [Gammaproteobacteria bacterium]